MEREQITLVRDGKFAYQHQSQWMAQRILDLEAQLAVLGAMGCDSVDPPKMPGRYDDGGRAFPRPDGAGGLSDRGGMTLRDYFAAHASSSTTKIGDFTPEEVAEWNYRYADEMLRVRAANPAVEAKGGE